jgi:hypothetical protein
LALFFAALALAPALAHLLELPNKIGLPRDEYLGHALHLSDRDQRQIAIHATQARGIRQGRAL